MTVPVSDDDQAQAKAKQLIIHYVSDCIETARVLSKPNLFKIIMIKSLNVAPSTSLYMIFFLLKSR